MKQVSRICIGALALCWGLTYAVEPVTPAPAASGTTADTPAPAKPAAVPGAATSVQVAVADLADPTVATFQALNQDLRRRLLLTFDSKGAQDTLQVDVSMLTRANGNAVAATLIVDGATAAPSRSLTLKASSPVTLQMQAALPETGDYFGELRFRFGNQPVQVKPIRVTRLEPAAPPITVSVPTIQKTGFFQRQLVFNVAGPAVGTATITAALVKFDHKNGMQAPHELTLAPKGPFDLVDGIPKEVAVTLDGQGAGEFAGELSFGGKGFTAKPVPFSFTDRYGWGWAGLVILAGALLALALKQLSALVRPRLVVREAVATLQAQMDGVSRSFEYDDDELYVLSALREPVDRAYVEAASAGTPVSPQWADTTRALLVNQGKRLELFPVWVNAKRLSEKAAGAASKVALDTQVATERSLLVSDDPPSNGRELRRLMAEVRLQVKDIASNATNMARAQIDDAANQTADVATLELLDGAKRKVARADAALQAGNLHSFKQEYSAADLAYVRAVTSLVDSACAAAPPADAAQVVAQLSYARVAVSSLEAGSHLERALLSVPIRGLTRNLAGNLTEIPQVPSSKVSEVRTTVREDTGQLSQRIFILDIVVDVVAVIAAAGMGIVLVWSPNPTWGSPVDLVTAFLWGLGLQAVGSSTFTGLTDLKTKLTK